jgi:pyruvate/2-oxoglutarate dehydrogenase complex dihydrolipoamide acyltransferase (E2) component
VVPLTKMRAIIAQRMVESVRISPHVHTVYKVDMTRIARLREREKAPLRAAARRQADLYAVHRRRRRRRRWSNFPSSTPR